MAPNKEDTVVPPGDCKASERMIDPANPFVKQVIEPVATIFVVSATRAGRRGFSAEDKEIAENVIARSEWRHRRPACLLRITGKMPVPPAIPEAVRLLSSARNDSERSYTNSLSKK